MLTDYAKAFPSYSTLAARDSMGADVRPQCGSCTGPLPKGNAMHTAPSEALVGTVLSPIS